MHFHRQTPSKLGIEKSKYCRFQKRNGHNTEDCIHIKDEIEILIRYGHLKQYKKKEGAREEAPETKNIKEGKESPDINTIPFTMSISRPEYLYCPDMENIPLYYSSHSSWESFPAAMVISSGGFNRHTMGSVKRRFDQLIKANSDMDTTPDKLRGGSHPLAFYKEELSGKAPNSTILLLIRARMGNFDVRRILVDHGSSVYIMYSQLFTTL